MSWSELNRSIQHREMMNLLLEQIAQNSAILKHLAALTREDHPVEMAYRIDPMKGHKVDPVTGKKLKAK